MFPSSYPNLPSVFVIVLWLRKYTMTKITLRRLAHNVRGFVHGYHGKKQAITLLDICYLKATSRDGEEALGLGICLGF